MIELIFQKQTPQRLDRFILEACPGIAPGRLHRYLRENKVKLNGKKQPLGTLLHPGDAVRLFLPDAAAQPPAHPLAILYEDDALLAVNKPVGHRSQNETGPQTGTLLGDIRTYLTETGYTPLPGFTPALCHRLDTGTSGVLLAAKTPAALAAITGLLKHRQLEKQYVGLTIGHPQPAAGTLEGWLFKDARQSTVHVTRQKQPGAQPASLHYETLACSGRLALLRILPHTGRTHQIRAQLAAAGTPLLGDSKYGDAAVNRALKCRYQCLCAQALQFPTLPGSPWSGLRIQAPDPWFCAQALAGTLTW
ncbi:MAG: RluA family pseudouridine synthase [Ruminococcaceae bacterium]|nr:RluA family pseudouridine synthase [Oscillospiraceae bacterium]